MLTFLRKRMKTILIVVAVLFAASMFYGLRMTGGGRGAAPRQGLAKINGKEIDFCRYQELLNRFVRQFEGKLNLSSPQDMAFVENFALNQTLDFMLILGEAKKKVRISGREVDLALESIMKKEEIPSKRDLEGALNRIGLSLPKFKSMLRDEMLVQKMTRKIGDEVRVTADDLKEVRASHILVSTEAEANNLLTRVNKGEDFSSLAQKYSMDAGSKNKGGDLGYFTTGAMVEPFEKAAFALKIGERSKPIKSQFGYHVIKVTDLRLRKFEGKEIEKAALAEKQQKAFQKWYLDIRKRTKIEIISPKLKGHDFKFRGRILEAIQEYKKAIAESPSSPYLHIFLGDSYNVIGKAELALSEYEKAVELEGGNFELYIILAKAYEKAGKKDPALEQYRRASLLAGDSKDLHERLLKIFKELKAGEEIKREKAEIVRIEKKEKFEKELKGEGPNKP